MIARRNFLLGAAALAGAGGIGYAHYYEPGWPEVTHQRIAFFNHPLFPLPFKILFTACT